MLVRMWRKGNSFHCWWECRLVQPLWKAVWKYLKKLKMDLPFGPVIPLLWKYPKKSKTLIQNNISAPMFIVALFTTAKIWKQPVPSSWWVDKVTMRHIHNGILVGCKEEENLIICHKLDAPGEHYAEWDKPIRERQIPYDFTYMWNLLSKLY